MVKTGLIGCGRIGYEFDLDPNRAGIWTHAGAYNSCIETDFTMVYDIDDEKAQKCAQRHGVTLKNNSDQDQVLQDMVENLDIISIAVPQDLHEFMLEKLLKIFKKSSHVPKILWVEKPFIGNYKKASTLVHKFLEYGTYIHVNYQRRFCFGFHLLKSYGRPKHAHVAYVRGMYNTASHFVDLMIGLYGEPVKVTPVKFNSDFVMHYFGFNVSFSMLEGLKYNMCDTTFYYDDQVVVMPPIQSYCTITKAVKSEQYSEYMDLGDPEKLYLNYDPMVAQAHMLARAIKTNDFDELNNGLTTLEALERVYLDTTVSI